MQIKSGRVTLGRTTQEDLPFLKSLWNDGRVMKWVGFPNGVGDTDETMAAWFRKRSSDPTFFHFIVWDTDNCRCGEVCYGVETGQHRAGLDVKFAPESQGRGLATDALRALINHVFAVERDVDEVWTEPSPQNLAARRLYARCGLAEKPRPRDMKQDVPYWALERSRWIELKTNAEKAHAPDALPCAGDA
jgi:RimJ/RimL family protein N-acetyltransferase